jgi:hypothetical protein
MENIYIMHTFNSKEEFGQYLEGTWLDDTGLYYYFGEPNPVTHQGVIHVGFNTIPVSSPKVTGEYIITDFDKKELSFQPNINNPTKFIYRIYKSTMTQNAFSFVRTDSNPTDEILNLKRIL